jgi:hypothetical protein
MLRAVVFACAAVAVFAVDLSSDTFAQLTSGKTVFIKFYASWQA